MSWLYFLFGLVSGFAVLLLLFTLPVLNTYGVDAWYDVDSQMVCYHPVSVVSGVKSVIYHEECHALVFDDPEHFCKGEGWIYD